MTSKKAIKCQTINPIMCNSSYLKYAKCKYNINLLGNLSAKNVCTINTYKLSINEI